MSYIEFEDANGLKYRVNQNGNLKCYPGQGIEPITILCSGLDKTESDSVLEKLYRHDRNINEPIIFATSAKEEKKMSKFKVGDIVRVKPVEELDKVNPLFTDGIRKMASTNNEIASVFPYTNNEGANETAYFLKGYEGYYFNDSMLEDRTYSKDDIFSINVIVYGKVVEVEFYDGKEKMICHEDDVFDLRRCCFIAIAKHLYKNEYTPEGIEYMATQLAYQKRYVKVVDKALKDYWKKEEEKEKRIHEEQERKEIQERQKEKRRKYKERRAQKHREAMVDLIADSINEAKVRRKADK